MGRDEECQILTQLTEALCKSSAQSADSSGFSPQVSPENKKEALPKPLLFGCCWVWQR